MWPISIRYITTLSALSIVSHFSFVTYGCSYHYHIGILTVEAYHTEEILFEKPVWENEIFVYCYKHSVFRDNVYQTYTISPNGDFLLKMVTSSQRVLSLPYPGFEIPIDLEQGNKEFLTIEINKVVKELIIVAGGESTLIFDGKTIPLINIGKDGTILRIYLKKHY